VPLPWSKTLLVILYLTYVNVFFLLFLFRGVPVKVLQAAREHLAKEESVGWWRSIRSRHIFKSTSPDTSPLGWSPQVRVFFSDSSLFNFYMMWKIQLSSDEPLVSFCSFSLIFISFRPFHRFAYLDFIEGHEFHIVF